MIGEAQTSIFMSRSLSMSWSDNPSVGSSILPLVSNARVKGVKTRISVPAGAEAGAAEPLSCFSSPGVRGSNLNKESPDSPKAKG